MKLTNVLFFVIASLMTLTTACTKSCAGAKKEEAVEKHEEVAPPAEENSVSFTEPTDGAEVTSPVKMGFKVVGKEVRKAEEGVHDDKFGHFHVLVDNPAGFIEKGQVIAKDDKNIHYGEGQSEATIDLLPGTHTLTLQFGDDSHISYGPEFAKKITVTVKEAHAE